MKGTQTWSRPRCLLGVVVIFSPTPMAFLGATPQRGDAPHNPEAHPSPPRLHGQGTPGAAQDPNPTGFGQNISVFFHSLPLSQNSHGNKNKALNVWVRLGVFFFLLSRGG